MKEHIEDLAQTKLFFGIEPYEIAGLLTCVHARSAQYSKEEMIIQEGSHISDFGIILSGHGRSVKWDASDKLIIITLLEKGSEIGVLLAANPEQESPVSVQAQDEVSVLFIPYDALIARCDKTCPKHEMLLRNYIGIVAEKGLVLHERISCLLKPTLREKVMTYLIRVSREQRSQTFSIPLNRNAMSEYLNIERSALSRELSNMKRDGLIDYHRNSFKLLV
ncbi:MAG: Crp/Fnr family transcriptional regulator [Oscillospiraceae bacterium]|nr:Crp/Fnr family transcriptional regulator [Oscillospiraceae bacterium]